MISQSCEGSARLERRAKESAWRFLNVPFVLRDVAPLHTLPCEIKTSTLPVKAGRGSVCVFHPPSFLSNPYLVVFFSLNYTWEILSSATRVRRLWCRAGAEGGGLFRLVEAARWPPDSAKEERRASAALCPSRASRHPQLTSNCRTFSGPSAP